MSRGKVTLFVQCLVDSIFPEVAEAMVSVLEKQGLTCHYPAEQTCCGQPAYNSGYRREARKAALHFLDVFGDEDRIVCPSGSCVHMVRHHYPELFADDPALLEKAIDVGNRTFELSQYLVDELGVINLGARFPYSVTYHDSCHLSRGLGIGSQPRALLQAVDGLKFIEMRESDTCCGFGGTFAAHYPEISTAMVDDKIENILATGAEAVVGCDVSCLMNIQGRLSRRGEEVRVLHLAQVLAGEGGEKR